MSSYLENLPSITGNLGESVTILREFVLKTEEIEGGTRLIITSLRTGEVQVVDIMDGHTPVRGVDYWTENDQAEMTKAAEDAALAAFKVDETLSQEGMPADAGAVGEAVSKLSASVEEKQPSGDYALRSEIPDVPQNVLQYTEQTLSEKQKTQSRANIDAVAAGVVEELSQTVDAQGKAIDEKQPSGDYALRSELPVVPQNVLQYIEQTLTEEQKTQSRANIGAAAAGVVEELSQTVDAQGKAIDGKQPSGDYALRSEVPVVPQNVLQYTEQTLTEEQKTQSRANIGAVSTSEIPVESVNGKTGTVELSATDVGAPIWAGVLGNTGVPNSIGYGSDGEWTTLAYVNPNGQVRILPKHIRLNGIAYISNTSGEISLPDVYTPTNLYFGNGLQLNDSTVSIVPNGYKLLASYEFTETTAGVNITEIDGNAISLRAMAVIFDRIGDETSNSVNSNPWFHCTSADDSNLLIKGGYFNMVGAEGNCWYTSAEIDGEFLTVEAAAMNNGPNSQISNGWMGNSISRTLHWRSLSERLLPIKCITGFNFTAENSVTPGSRMWIYGKEL